MKNSISLLLLMLLMVGLFSCSSDTDDNSITVYLGWVPCQDYAFLYWARSEGYFEDVGIDNINIVPTRGSAEVAAALSTGAADFGFIGSETLVLAYEKEQLIKAVGVLYEHTPSTIMYHVNDSNIQSVEDLRGKKVGVILQSATYPLFRGMLKVNHLSENDVEEVIAIRGGLTQFIGGSVDALIHYSNHGPVSARHQGLNVGEFPMKDYGMDLYGLVLAGNKNMIEKHPVKAHKFVSAVSKALIDSREKQSEVQQAYLREFPEGDVELFSKQLKETQKLLTSGDKPLRMTRKGWIQTLETMHNVGQIDQPWSTTEIDKLLDMSFQ